MTKEMLTACLHGHTSDSDRETRPEPHIKKVSTQRSLMAILGWPKNIAWSYQANMKTDTKVLKLVRRTGPLDLEEARSTSNSATSETAQNLVPEKIGRASCRERV